MTYRGIRSPKKGVQCLCISSEGAQAGTGLHLRWQEVEILDATA